MITPTKRKRGQHAKHPLIKTAPLNKRLLPPPIDASLLAWIEFTTSDEYRAQLTCTHTAFMAGYIAGKDAK